MIIIKAQNFVDLWAQIRHAFPQKVNPVLTDLNPIKITIEGTGIHTNITSNEIIVEIPAKLKSKNIFIKYYGEE